MSILTTILGLFSGLSSLLGKVLDFFKEKSLMSQGREQHAAELAKEEIEINRKQTEILNQDRTKSDVIEKMKNGTF